jgi:hypothetical protein
MTSGLLYRFHGVISTEPTAAIMPPARQLIRCGLTLLKSNAGEMKLATMLMPIVAMVNVNAPNTIANVESIRATVSTGSVMSSPNTGIVRDAVTTTNSENTRKFTGKPRKLPRLTALNDLPYREKSPKFSIGPEKYDTTSAIAPSITGTDSSPV